MKTFITLLPLIIVWLVAIYMMITDGPKKVYIPIETAKHAIVEIDTKPEQIIYTN